MNRFNLNTEERNRILNLHESIREKTIKKIISEAGPYEDGEIPVPTTGTTVPTTGTTATPGTPAGPGLSGFNADSDGDGAPDYLQAQNPQDKSALTPATPGKTNYSAKDIQTWLNTNKQSGLVVDGKIGPKTIAAIIAALGVTTNVAPVGAPVGAPVVAKTNNSSSQTSGGGDPSTDA